MTAGPPVMPDAMGGGHRPAGTVVLDAMGGDHGPAETVAGAVTAWRVHGVPVVLVGAQAQVSRELRRHDAAGEIAVVHADDAVPMAERGAAAAAWAASSLVVGCELAGRGAGGAFVSAGSTGAVVSCAVRGIGRSPGVLRPALAVALPSLAGGASVLVDAGATADPSPPMVAQSALLGAGYARAVLGRSDPVVGLLSIGSEPGKGNRLTRRAAELLAGLPVRFHGNIEGHDVLTGLVDVIVTDGFTGNVVLKNVEGCVRTALTMVAEAGIASPERLAEVARRYDPETHGGAALLGLRGTVVVAHGSAPAATIARACAVAYALAGQGPVTGIESVAAEPVP
jgi:glycerol-3-phosphate acyltransferase PlsX